MLTVEKNDRLKTCILITSNGSLKIDNREFSPRIVSIKHPRSGKNTSFLLNNNNNVIEEIFLFSEKRSLFIDNFVVDEANIYFSTPFDPLFLILPHLYKVYKEKKVVPLEDLLIDDIHPEIFKFLKTSVLQTIHLIADKKGPQDFNAWMYNEQKTMEWLKKKTEKVAQFFINNQNYVKKAATSPNFVKTFQNVSSSLGNETIIKYAHELVSEYLEEELSTKLLSSLGLPVENLQKSISEKRKLIQVDGKEGKEMNKKAKKTTQNYNPSKGMKIKFNCAEEKPKNKNEKASQQITDFFKRK